jgi:hypothetical protein
MLIFVSWISLLEMFSYNSRKLKTVLALYFQCIVLLWQIYFFYPIIVEWKIFQIIIKAIVVKITSWLLKSYDFISQHEFNVQNQTKTKKLVKLDLTCVKSVKLVNSVKSVRFYEFTKFMIWTKSDPNLILKCLLTSFARLNISFKLYIG